MRQGMILSALPSQDLEKPPEEEDLGDIMSASSKKAAAISDEIDTAALALLEEERRQQFKVIGELRGYLIFVVAFMVVVLNWRLTDENFHMRNSLQVAILEEDFPLEAAHFQKNYFDIANGEELFTYLKLIFIEQIGLSDGGVVAGCNHLIGGLRFRQLRVGDGSCKVPSEYNKYPDMGCYAAFDKVGGNNNKPFGPNGRWKASEGSATAFTVPAACQYACVQPGPAWALAVDVRKTRSPVGGR